MEENLVKKTCKGLGINQKQLAEKIGVVPYTISRWVKGDFDKTVEVLLDALIYKKKFLDLQNIFEYKQNVYKTT